LAFLLGLRSVDALVAAPQVGAIWESAVIAEVRRQQINVRGGSDLFYWRDRSHEADLLMHAGGAYTCADVKWSTHVDARDGATLRKIEAQLPPGSRCTRALLTRAPNSHPMGDGTEVIAPMDLGAWSNRG